MFSPSSNFVLLLLLRLPGVLSVRILQIVPGFTNSHVLFNYRLAQTLVDMGHNVTLWTQMEMAMVFAGDLKLPDGVTEQRVPIHFRDRLKVEGLKVFQEMIFARGTPYELWWTGREFQEMRLEACEQMMHKADALREKWGHFDLAIGHFHDLCPVMLAERVGVDRMVWVTHGTSLYDFTAITLGIRTFPSFVPHPLSSNGDRMGFTGRLINLLWHLSGIEFVNLPERLLHDENKMYEKVSNGRANLWSLSARSVPVLLINGERFLDFPRPLPLNIGFMGELATVGKKAGVDGDVADELEPDLASVYSRPDSKGVVVFSMGTVSNTSNMPPEMAQSFLDAFSQMPNYDFLWKTEQTELAGVDRMPNVHLRRWIPQKKLMKHPKTRLLLAHGGYNSFLEAAKVGVPVVLVPLFADQHINAERAKRFGIAVTLDKLALSAEAIRGALCHVLEDRRYSLNARRLSTMLTDTPPASRIAPPMHLRHSLKLALSDRTELFTLKAAQALGFVKFHCVDLAIPLALLTALLSAASR
ncbi:putative UDP-glucuronosyltransferase ugt-60 [Globodera pallida]|nr:putative UDP-glucuronosyltransferase ugt-60 [Globodera pallida]